MTDSSKPNSEKFFEDSYLFKLKISANNGGKINLYLIESEKITELGLTEEDVRFNSYCRTVTTNADGEGWYVCEDFTKFE